MHFSSDLPDLPALFQAVHNDHNNACCVPVSGADHVLALQRDGVVLSWGVGLIGQLGRVGTRMLDPETTQLTPAAVPFKRTRAVKASSKIADIACGMFDSFACTADGHAFAWGLNNYSQLGFQSQVGQYRLGLY